MSLSDGLVFWKFVPILALFAFSGSAQAQSLRLQDISLGKSVQLGSYNYVKTANNAFMQSTEVTCPDESTVGGEYVKCFANKTKYEEQCSGDSSGFCTQGTLSNLGYIGTCACNSGYRFSSETRNCEFSGCGTYGSYNPTTDQCECDSGYYYSKLAGICIGCGNGTYNSKYNSCDYAYTGAITTFTASGTGTYKLEVWGAQGGIANANNSGYIAFGGNGGYSQGNIHLTQGQVIFIVVGGQGESSSSNSSSSGGYNGGGSSGVGSNSTYGRSGGGGGGATHMATRTGLLSSLSSNITAVTIVAGGGGGAGGNSACVWSSTQNYNSGGNGGTGGGENGSDGLLSEHYTNLAMLRGHPGSGGTSTSGGAGGTETPVGDHYCSGYAATVYAGGGGGGGAGWYGGGGASGGARSNNTGKAGADGSFGSGGSGGSSGGSCSSAPTDRCGPGGGGGGGSGYVGGVTDGQMFNGETEFADPDGSIVTGHSGNGYARIIEVSVD